MAYRQVIEIEDHATTLKIKGFATYYSDCGRIAAPMQIHGIVDGKRFSMKTSGHMTIKEIVESIVRETR